MMNPMQMFQAFQQFRNNPTAVLSRLNLPENVMNNPQAAVQHLMNNGQMSQQQFNQLSNMANQLANNQQFMSMFGKK